MPEEIAYKSDQYTVLQAMSNAYDAGETQLQEDLPYGVRGDSLADLIHQVIIGVQMSDRSDLADYYRAVASRLVAIKTSLELLRNTFQSRATDQAKDETLAIADAALRNANACAGHQRLNDIESTMLRNFVHSEIRDVTYGNELLSRSEIHRAMNMAVEQVSECVYEAQGQADAIRPIVGASRPKVK